MNHLKKFQQKVGLTPDGEVGKDTFNKMLDYFNVKPLELVYFLGQFDYETNSFTGGIGNFKITNKERFAQKARDLSVLNNTSTIEDKYYFESGIYFFNENNLWRYCENFDNINIVKISKSVDLGDPNNILAPEGLQHRIEKTHKYYELYQKIKNESKLV